MQRVSFDENGEVVEEAQEEAKTYICDFCDAKFSSEKDLSKHYV